HRAVARTMAGQVDEDRAAPGQRGRVGDGTEDGLAVAAEPVDEHPGRRRPRALRPPDSRAVGVERGRMGLGRSHQRRLDAYGACGATGLSPAPSRMNIWPAYS